MATSQTEKTLELKVGAFVVVGLAVLAALVVQFGRVGEGFKTYYGLTVRFPDASGLLKGSDVLLAGAKIGRVSGGPRLVRSGQGVEVPLRIFEYVRVPAGSKFTVGSSGLLGDRFGAKRILVFGLLAQAFGALGYVFVRELSAFYAVAALFGFIYAGTMPLYAVLVRENFPLRMMGTVIGGTAMAGSLGMATGPLAGGLIYDTFASYAWLYIGSWLMGLGAFLIILMFRPMPAARAAAPVRA